VADVAVIAAARLALDPSLAVEAVPGVGDWLKRWARIDLLDPSGRVLPDKVGDLLLRAGRTARLTRRPGALDFKAGPTAHDIARDLGAAGIDYALTGDAGANLYQSSAGETWPVLYVEDVDRAQAAARLTRKEPGAFGMRVTLIPFDGVCELGRTTIDGITVAARDQVILDACGGIDRMAEQADVLVGRITP
jgi:hypothetical protein